MHSPCLRIDERLRVRLHRHSRLESGASREYHRGCDVEQSGDSSCPGQQTRVNGGGVNAVPSLVTGRTSRSISRSCTQKIDGRWRSTTCRESGAVHRVRERAQAGSRPYHTDVIMPGMNGCERANRIPLLRPGRSVLFVSCATNDVFAPLGRPFAATAPLGRPVAPASPAVAAG